MLNSFQKHHLLKIFTLFDEASLPLDVFLSQYFRAHKAIGSKDRRLISETVYGMVRWKGLLGEGSWEERFQLFLSIDLLKTSKNHAPHTRVSFPEELFEILVESYGEKKAEELCLICNTEAPTTVRVNLAKTTREALFQEWKNKYAISLSSQTPSAIIFHKRINFFSLPEFKEGLFEIQDEGSQRVADLLSVKPGDLILDFCAGAGGKSLALAPRTQNKGQIYLHDIRPRALQEAKKRLKRAGVQNAQILHATDRHKNALKGKMDWVLVDAPCSGSGTYRRNPDLKWKFSQKMLDNLLEEQREIFKEALEFASPKGHLVYATCSILSEENEQQIAYFEKHFSVVCVEKPFSLLPSQGGPDGFFGAVFRKKSTTMISSPQ